MAHSGGIYAQILNDGVLTAGDVLTLNETAQ